MKAKNAVVRDGFLEEVAVVLSLLKWVALASVAGATIGGAVALFLKAVAWSTTYAANEPWRLFLLPVGGLATGWLVHTFAPDAAGHGTEAVIRAIHTQAGKVRAAVVPIKAAATVITLGTWGSAGKEGPAAQIGSGVTSILADLLHLGPRDRRKLAVCGISAGFAAVFGMPVAGSIFGIEVLAIGAMFYEYLLPSFVAGVTALEVTRRLGINYPVYHLQRFPLSNEALLLKLLVLGCLLGVVSLLFIEALNLAERSFRALRVPPIWRPAIGGLVLLALTPLGSKEYLGLSLNLLDLALSGVGVAITAFLWKILFTAVTLGSGGSGGVITPLFVVGATAGSVFGGWLGFSPQLGAALGMIGLVAGAANTPISAAIMGIELFGPHMGVLAVATSVASFLAVGHRSIYPSQILAVRKAGAVSIGMDAPIEHRHARVGSRLAREAARVKWLIRRFFRDRNPRHLWPKKLHHAG